METFSCDYLLVISGNHGNNGNNGATGHEGAKGEKGDKGDLGPRGERGQHGPKGEKGYPGVPPELQVSLLGHSSVRLPKGPDPSRAGVRQPERFFRPQPVAGGGYASAFTPRPSPTQAACVRRAL